MANRDEMSFGKAFADARRKMGAGKTFTWRGNKYTTDLAEESGRSSRTPTESPRPQARRRSTEEIARSASAAIDRAEGKPATRPRQNPRRVPGPNEGTATSVETSRIERSNIPTTTQMPAVVRRAIEDAPPEDRRGATRIAEQGTRKRVPGGAIVQAIKNFLSGEGPTDPAVIVRGGRNSTGMARGGMVKNGNTDRRGKGMFYDSKSPRGYK